jgi:transcriptional regulator with XRE-family HTH domain
MANLTRKQRFGRNFGEAVKAQRLAKGWPLAKAQKETGVDMGNLSKIERGEIVPRLDTALRVVTGLGAKIEDVTRFYTQ